MTDAQINALVAKHVLGLKHEVCDRYSGGARLSWLDYDPLGGAPEVTDHPPDACNDGNVMLRVIEAIRSRQETEYLIFDVDSRSRGFVVEFGCDEVGVDVSLPRAVALAALKALDVEVPE